MQLSKQGDVMQNTGQITLRWGGRKVVLSRTICSSKPNADARSRWLTKKQDPGGVAARRKLICLWIFIYWKTKNL